MITESFEKGSLAGVRLAIGLHGASAQKRRREEGREGK
jgi:hypothetical protein